MPQKSPLSRTPFASIRQVGLGGLVLKGDPQDIKDVESPDLRNITFDSGVVGPRNGTTLFTALPNGETGAPTQLLKAKDSNGTTYLIGVFGVNFYLLDQLNKAWVKLNGTYSPSTGGLFYGSANWNFGTGSDAFYFGNGVDSVMKWAPYLTYLSVAALSADTQITVADSSLLPSSGPITVGGTAATILHNQTSAFAVFYSAGTYSNPTDGQTLLLNINGTTVTINFVSAIGVAAGNVLIGASLAATLTNLYGLLTAPGTTSATQVALAGGDQTLVGYLTYSNPDGIEIIMTGGTSVQYLIITGTASTTIKPFNPTNIVALSGALGANVAKGAVVTNQIVSVPSIPNGNVFSISTASGSGFRLFVSGVSRYENYVFFSKAFDWTSPSATTQEDFTSAATTFTGSGLPGAGGQVVPYGEGGIVDLVDFGSYLAAVKANGLANLAFTIDTTNDTTTLVPSSLIFGESIFPVGQNVDIIIENALYITTASQGIYQLTPASTGNTLTTTFTPFSDNILSLFKSGQVSFANARTSFFNRALYIPCSTIPGVNDIILIFDFVWNAWSIWDNLNAADMQEANGTFFILCSDDGGLYYIDPTSYQDFRNGQVIAYDTYLLTKRFDWGKPANIKQQSLALIQGYIMQSTKLYIDVLFNENGSLAAATYEIDGNNSDYVQQIPLYGPGRISLGQNPIGGTQVGTIGVFRVYLDLLYGAGAHVVSFKPRSSDIGANWGLTGISVNQEENEVVPTQMMLGVA